MSMIPRSSMVFLLSASIATIALVRCDAFDPRSSLPPSSREKPTARAQVSPVGDRDKAIGQLVERAKRSFAAQRSDPKRLHEVAIALAARAIETETVDDYFRAAAIHRNVLDACPYTARRAMICDNDDSNSRFPTIFPKAHDRSLLLEGTFWLLHLDVQHLEHQEAPAHWDVSSVEKTAQLESLILLEQARREDRRLDAAEILLRLVDDSNDPWAFLKLAQDEHDRAPEGLDKRGQQFSIDIKKAKLLLDIDAKAAFDLANKLIDQAREGEYNWRLSRLLDIRAKANRRLGAFKEAEADHQEMFNWIDRCYGSLSVEPTRAMLFEHTQSTYDHAILDALSEPLRALFLADRSRQTFKSQFRPNEDAKSQLETLVDAIPFDTAMIEFAVLDDRLVTWIVFRGRVAQIVQDAPELSGLVETAWRALATRTTPTKRLQAHLNPLSTQLVSPWIEQVEEAKTLLISPDRYLHKIAWSALPHPVDGRPLAARFKIATTPSLVAAATKIPRRLQAGVDISLFGDPALCSPEFSRLDRLPGAAEEVRIIESVYSRDFLVERYLDADANRQTFLSSLKTADIVHFAGHAVQHPVSQWESYLGLPSCVDKNGPVSARDIYSLDGPTPRLVVLSACGTAPADDLRAAGFAPLVSAFLANGTEHVIYSMWAVGDQEIPRMTVELHRGLARGLSPLDALHRARLLMINEAPHLWASLQLTSG